MSRIAIIDYGMGNLKNVQKAFLSIEKEAFITNKKEEIIEASHIVLPGVGAFPDAMKTLHQTGLSQTIQQEVAKGKPFLGICLGMQLLFEESDENEKCEGLGILEGKIVKLEVPLKVPHMGWNTLEITKQKPLFEGVPDGSYAYFVHSYYLETTKDIVSSYTTYGKRIAVAVQKENVFAAQFHPEKSDQIGLKMLENFANFKA